MKTRIPTYTHSLLQVSNSVRKFCELPLLHASLPELDAWLNEQEVDQLLVLLIDGMGTHQLETYCNEDGFFRTHLVTSVESTYPPTTVAATTTLRTGRFPSETGWLAWHQYHPSVDDDITTFQNKGYFNHKDYPDFIEQLLPIVTNVQAYNDNKQEDIAIELFPWTRPKCATLSGLLEESFKELEEGKRFVYSYYDAYDSHMHDYGVDVPSSIQMLQDIEETIASYVNQLPKQTGLVILADHGHIDVEEVPFFEYHDLMDLLVRKPTFEFRAVNFYVKEGQKELFELRFNEHFKDSFHLYTKDEVIKLGLFGEVGKQPKGEMVLGDFLACATSNQILNYDEARYGEFKGDHSGMSVEEIMIPLILYNK